MVQTITDWLAGYLGGLEVDGLGPGEGWALFPQGIKLLRRSADILGNEQLRQRLTVLVRLHRADTAAVHRELEDLGVFVRENAPVLGREQTVRLENARLTALNKEGMARYEAKLVFEFTQ